jgi:hypothetical protein
MARCKHTPEQKFREADPMLAEGSDTSKRTFGTSRSVPTYHR